MATSPIERVRETPPIEHTEIDTFADTRTLEATLHLSNPSYTPRSQLNLLQTRIHEHLAQLREEVKTLDATRDAEKKRNLEAIIASLEKLRTGVEQRIVLSETATPLTSRVLLGVQQRKLILPVTNDEMLAARQELQLLQREDREKFRISVDVYRSLLVTQPPSPNRDEIMRNLQIFIDDIETYRETEGTRLGTALQHSGDWLSFEGGQTYYEADMMTDKWLKQMNESKGWLKWGELALTLGVPIATFMGIRGIWRRVFKQAPDTHPSKLKQFTKAIAGLGILVGGGFLVRGIGRVALTQKERDDSRLRAEGRFYEAAPSAPPTAIK